MIASGTVFNQILLWHLEGESLFSSSSPSSPSSPSSSSSSSSSSPALRVKVQLFLSGHEVPNHALSLNLWFNKLSSFLTTCRE